MDTNNNYQLRFAVPQSDSPLKFVVVKCDEHEVISIEYCDKGNPLRAQNYLAGEVAAQLRAYFCKPQGHCFDLPLLRAPTSHQQKVREVVSKVPFGKWITYGEVARKIGKPDGSRAVGQACKRNPAALVVPCHRVVAADSIGGYIGGGAHVRIKHWLLKHEGINHFAKDGR